MLVEVTDGKEVQRRLSNANGSYAFEDHAPAGPHEQILRIQF